MTNNTELFELILGRLRSRQSTLLGISPISRYVLVSSLKVADRARAPLLLVASLNQVDIDGGYAGFTPSSLVRYVNDVVKEHDLNPWVIFQVDHCGPWLKDDHVVKNYSYDEAMDAILKSMEEFIKAGFNLIHVDTTIDLEKPDGTADVSTAAERTAQLIDLAEDIARRYEARVKYEVGSDRWGYKPVNVFDEFLSRVVVELKKRGLSTEKIVFAVADVGTKVKPGNRVDEYELSSYSKATLRYDLLLKVHSGDYLENPDILPKYRVGGVNIGPMFADIQYRLVKQALLNIQRLDLLDRLNTLIIRGDKAGKYTRKEKPSDYEIGLASRYIWSTTEAQELINVIEKYGIPVSKNIHEEIEKVVDFYMEKLNLKGFLQ